MGLNLIALPASPRAICSRRAATTSAPLVGALQEVTYTTAASQSVNITTAACILAHLHCMATGLRPHNDLSNAGSCLEYGTERCRMCPAQTLRNGCGAQTCPGTADHYSCHRKHSPRDRSCWHQQQAAKTADAGGLCLLVFNRQGAGPFEVRSPVPFQEVSALHLYCCTMNF